MRLPSFDMPASLKHQWAWRRGAHVVPEWAAAAPSKKSTFAEQILTRNQFRYFGVWCAFFSSIFVWFDANMKWNEEWTKCVEEKNIAEAKDLSCEPEHTSSLVAAAKHASETCMNECVRRAERCACMNNLLSDFDIVLQRICHFHISAFASICVRCVNGCETVKCVSSISSFLALLLCSWRMVMSCVAKEINLRRCPVVWMNNR